MPTMEERLLTIINDAPDGQNGYEFAGSKAAWLFVDKGTGKLLGPIIAINVVYGLAIAACATLIWKRSQKKGIFWFIRTEQTSIGTFVIPHAINASLLMNMLFCFLAIPASWQSYLYQTTADPTYWVALIMLAGTIFITLILVPWMDVIVLTVSALDFQRMSTSLSAVANPRWAVWWLPVAINIITFAVPGAIFSLSLTLFLLNYFFSFRPMLDEYHRIQDMLYAAAPNWTGSVTLDDLSPFSDVLADCYTKANYTAFWYRVGFAMWLAAVMLLYFIWIPLIIRYKYIVNWQIGQLKEAAGSLASHRIRVQELEMGGSASKQPKMSVEKKVKALIAVVHFRVFLLACLTAALLTYMVILFLVMRWSHVLVDDTKHIFGLDIAAMYGCIWTITPCLVAAIFGQTELTKSDPALITTQFTAWQTKHTRSTKLTTFRSGKTSGAMTGTTVVGGDDESGDETPKKSSSTFKGIKVTTHRHIVIDAPSYELKSTYKEDVDDV